jgi:hypothetical protein
MDSIKNFIKNKLEFKEMNSIVGGDVSGCVYYQNTNHGCVVLLPLKHGSISF